ncbi:MAG TPA: hypothetical protein VF933_10165 [Streptosporangiaceae bacterium]
MTFSAAHILATAALTGLAAAGVAWWKLRRWPDILAVFLVSGAAVFLWRISANMPQLNDDGLPGFSANDWAAPVLTYLSLSVYADLRQACRTDAFRVVRALAALACLVINVVTI